MRLTVRHPVFLSAGWHDLLFANYVVDPEMLTPFVPQGVELDLYDGDCYVSLVAFRFCNTKVFGVPAFSKRDFDEINLRFYVNRTLPDGKDRSGVVFIQEIVPSRLVAWVARVFYGENYIAMNMEHEITPTKNQAKAVSYQCGVNSPNNRISAVVSPKTSIYSDEGLESYITEHYWGYSGSPQTRTVEYEVKHPKWPVNEVSEHSIDFDFVGIYGKPYRLLSETEPTSVFYCQGSDVTVHLGTRI